MSYAALSHSSSRSRDGAQLAKHGEVVADAGLTNMNDRVDVLGGSIQLSSHPGAGTCVRGTLPAPTRVATPSLIRAHSWRSVIQRSFLTSATSSCGQNLGP
jgi:hypothetical protein